MYLNQDFYQIRDQCLAEKKLFEDPFFEFSDKTIKDSSKYTWLRPKEIVEKPEFNKDGFSLFDVNQGALGDCWFLAAVASLAEDPQLFANVVHGDNDFGEEYAGIFHFRFWLYGDWVDVVVDDRLPTHREKKNLVFLRSKSNDEFWPALIEKAYAKFYGSYAYLHGGQTSEAQEDFTGGVSEKYRLKSVPSDFFTILEKALEKRALIGCAIDANKDGDVDENDIESITKQGLVTGHVYSVTGAKLITLPQTTEKLQMVRLRNPWGQVEWKGAWSDQSKEWKSISETEKNSIGLTIANDGEFWMSYKDFALLVTVVDICNLLKSFTHTSMLEFEEQKNWHLRKGDGEWKIDISAGGCRNFMETFHTNPKFILKLNTPDENDNDGMCSIIVALLQKNRRRLGLKHWGIGYSIYNISKYQDTQIFDKEFFKKATTRIGDSGMKGMRGNTARWTLHPGKYLIVPSTFKPNEEAEFLLRVLSESSCDLIKL